MLKSNPALGQALDQIVAITDAMSRSCGPTCSSPDKRGPESHGRDCLVRRSSLPYALRLCLLRLTDQHQTARLGVAWATLGLMIGGAARRFACVACQGTGNPPEPFDPIPKALAADVEVRQFIGRYFKDLSLDFQERVCGLVLELRKSKCRVLAPYERWRIGDAEELEHVVRLHLRCLANIGQVAGGGSLAAGAAQESAV